MQRIRQDNYRATYGPLISLISERCTNDDSMDLAIGRPMEEHRFVIALTYEKLDTRRARHLRAMVMWEPMLLNLPEAMPRVDFEEHKVRYRTLQTISKLYRKHPERFGMDVFEGGDQVALFLVGEGLLIRDEKLHVTNLRFVDGGMIDLVEDAVRCGVPDAA